MTKWNSICYSSFEFDNKNYTYVYNKNFSIGCANNFCEIQYFYDTVPEYIPEEGNIFYDELMKHSLCFTDNYLRVPYLVTCFILIGLICTR